MMFREVSIGGSGSGRLLLHSMPGRSEPLAHVFDELRAQRISAIVCLAGHDEVRQKSPEYRHALDNHMLPCPVRMFPIPDFGVPDDRSGFWSLAREVAKLVQSGERILIHCGAGIGRTGMLAECVLVALGKSAADAHQAVTDAGSRAEAPEQRAVISWCASQSMDA